MYIDNPDDPDFTSRIAKDIGYFKNLFYYKTIIYASDSESIS